MTKRKHLKGESLDGGLKKKKLDVNVSDVSKEGTPGQKKKKSRKSTELEQAPTVIPDAPIKLKNEKQKKQKKKKKTESNEISDPPSRPEESVQGEEDLTPEEKRVLERKMKKILKKEEKKRLREEGETQPKTEGPTAAQQALDYLTCWSKNRPEWKFQKTRQTWLLQHMFDSEKISDEKFSVLLEYLEGLRGAAKDTTVQKALVLVQQSGEEADDTSIQQRAQRAREVIQLLS